MCTCECMWDGHEDQAVCWAALDILSVLLEVPGQRTPGWSGLPILPHPQASGLAPAFPHALSGRKPKPKPAQSRRPDLSLVLGAFQATGKSLKMRNNLEEQLTQSLKSLRMVRNTLLAQLPLARALPAAPGADQLSPCCSQPLSRPKSCSPSRPTLLPAVSCWRCKCPLPSCSLVSLWYAK